MNAIEVIDLHGMNLDEARDALDEALRAVDMSVYRLRVIHGFNNGTAIQNMIRREYVFHMKVIRVARGPANGQTDLILREF